jgi:hypothetical protein
MPAVSFKNMDVNALLGLRKEVERTLTERRRDLQRQIALLGGERKRPGRPAATRCPCALSIAPFSCATPRLLRDGVMP